MLSGFDHDYHMQSYYAMGVAQYKVAEDYLFAALKGAPCSPTCPCVRSHVYTMYSLL